MTRIVGATAIGMWVMVGAALGAADIWESKPFVSWSDKEMKDLLDESPWTGRAGLTHTRPGGNAQPIEDKVHVSWTSALPLRQARVRELVGQNGMLTPDLETFVVTPMPVYVVTFKIEGFSAGAAARTVVQITKDTSLRRDGKPPIAVAEAQSAQLDKDGKPVEPSKAPAAAPAPPPPPGGRGGGRGGFGGGFGGPGNAGGSTVIVFAFPKTDAITADDKEVEIVSKVGQYNVRKKFKLKDMVVKGELAL